MLVTEKPSTPALYKALSVAFKSRLIFGETKKSAENTALLNTIGIEISKWPALLVLPKQEGDVQSKFVKYDGKITSFDYQAR